MGDAPQQPPRDFGWTLPQRRALIALLSLLLGWMAFRLATNSAHVPDPQPAEGTRAGELATRINPNTADWETLAAIPSLGAKRAREIVARREHLLAASPNRVPFAGPEDLLHIRGIGPATVENIKPYLIFPPGPTTGARVE